MNVKDTTAARRLQELLGYVEQVVKLDEKVAFKIADFRLATGQTYHFHQYQFHALPGVRHDQSDEDGPIWLTVERLKRRNPPAPPDAIGAWIEMSNDPEKTPTLRDFTIATVSLTEKEKLIEEKKARPEDCHPALAREDKDKFDVRLRLEDRQDIVAEGAAYISGPWLSWSNEETPRRRCISHRSEVAAAMDGLSQNVGPVRSHEGRDLDPIQNGIGAGHRIGFGSHRIDAGIRAAAVGEILNSVVDIFVAEIERHRAAFSRQRKPFRHGIDGDDALRADTTASAPA